MIGRIKGNLVHKAPPDIMVDVQGVGYELQVPMTTFYRLPELEHTVSLHTHLVVREDAHLLYGFYDGQEREMFRSLIKINGVGPKLALGILSGIEANDLVRVVRNQDAAALERLPGIGKKTAERLIIEMRDRLKNWDIGDQQPGDPVPEVAQHGRQAVEEAESALIALGYKPKEASRAISAVADDSLSSQELIRQSLKTLVKT